MSFLNNAMKMNILPHKGCCFQTFRCVRICRFHATSTYGARTQPENTEIVVPRRIPRGPTDLLQAIASTVQKDFRSPPYKYIDDPETTPTATISKKAFSLAKASGQRAAQYVMKRYPKNFLDNSSDPVIQDFMLPLEPQHSEDTEEGLKERIELRNVEDAFNSYKKIKETGSELSKSTIEELFDLLCVYNGENPVDPLRSDEQVYAHLLAQDNSRERVRKTWKDGGPAEEIFLEMKEPTAKCYCSLIRGRAKFFQVDKAYELFKEMRAKDMKPDIDTWNAILGISGYVQNRVDDKVTFVKKQLVAMREQGLYPTVHSFDKVFTVFARCSKFNPPLAAKFASSLLNEMDVCGIEPSLSCWNSILRIFYVTDESQSNVLHEIMNRLEGKHLETTQVEDLDFFSTAMAKCNINLKDLELSYRIDTLLNHGQNYKLVGDTFKEGIYFSYFLKNLCMFEQVDTIMEYYDKFVPHAFTPTFLSLDDLFQALELNEGFEYIPKIWSDIYSFGYNKSVQLFEKIGALMASQQQPEPLQHQLFELMMARFEENKLEISQLEEKELLGRTEVLSGVTALFISQMCQVCLYAKETEEAIEVFNFYLDFKSKLKGKFNENTLVDLIDVFLENKDFDNCLEVLKALSDFAHASMDSIADKVKSQLELTEDQKQMIEDLL